MKNKILRNEKLNRKSLSNSVDYLTIYTVRVDIDMLWHYDLFAKFQNQNDSVLFRAAFGSYEGCSCYECIAYGREVNELVSVKEALRYLKSTFEAVPIKFCTDSRNFEFLFKDHFDYYRGGHTCEFMDSLFADICDTCRELGLDN
jgi:hypothetical protein